MLDSTIIKKKAREYGADLVGIAHIGRFEGVSPLHDPRMIMPRAQSVIGAAFRVPRTIMEAMASGPQTYAYTSLGIKTLEEEVATTYLMKMARVIEDAGYEASLQRSAPNLLSRDDEGTNPEALRTFRLDETRPVAAGKPAPDVMLDFTGAAVLCGMGTPGYRGNLITSRFGPFQRLCFIITNAPLAPDPIIEEPLCDGCGECVRACPGHAITEIAGQPIWDRWQCSVYYRGAHRSNPFMTADFLGGHPERESVLDGTKRFNQEEALAIYDRLRFLPPPQYEFTPCLCGKACDMACYNHLMDKGVIRKPTPSPIPNGGESHG